MKKKKAKRKRSLPKRDDRSVFEIAKKAGLIGCAPGLPRDLSTNNRYFEGFGESKSSN